MRKIALTKGKVALIDNKDILNIQNIVGILLMVTHIQKLIINRFQ